MPRLDKFFIHNTAVELCFRTQEGLPFVATPYMRVILMGIFARAQELYGVTLCHLVVMPNHMHLIITIGDSTRTKFFVEYIKRETAHAVNRLQGRRQRTVWVKGYDSPTILDPEKAIARIV